MPLIDLRPRHPTSICSKCRKPFAKGDRVCIAHIVVDVGFNKAHMVNGAWLSEEFEVVHVMCENPQLLGTVLVTPGGV